MKYKQVLASLIKMSVICGVLLLVFGILYVLISGYMEGLSDDINQLSAKSSGGEAQYMQLQKQVEDATEAAAFYKEFSEKGGTSPQSYRRDYVKDMLVRIKDENDIIELKFSMDQFLKQEGEYETPNVAVFISKINIQFTANSDVEVFNMLADIINDFPGYVKIDTIRLVRNRMMDDSFLDQIADGRRVPLISGDIVLYWRAIQDNPEYTGKKKKSGSPMPPGAMLAPQLMRRWNA